LLWGGEGGGYSSEGKERRNILSVLRGGITLSPVQGIGRGNQKTSGKAFAELYHSKEEGGKKKKENIPPHYIEKKE